MVFPLIYLLLQIARILNKSIWKVFIYAVRTLKGGLFFNMIKSVLLMLVFICLLFCYLLAECSVYLLFH
ncbi:hypothetical protein DKS73_24820 [Salmonella enterica subsp. enterica serovar Virchow]|uniref:Uncharacterized protein n=1 Tax=Salmonella virchow TaxID=48409 RepID=A0A5H5UST8_SALVI|nr:hypothetical protein [Salmonella enterica subsp. enterica]EAM9796569.1 hypothetical protein [Salmonella enterica]EBS3200585.1 hypothetical protein [Salmonella enterica subsp. enterica serovar Heidelberg]EBU6772382.1 hypothetical protein [Salmonella enterica subsp. enterica serovar Virchow]EBY0394386.1 hypothetical protein [Salmonella enterica subsp. enterica serovar Miami]ECJ4606650.1 hypothetical protein [Salmonella enterica subsp. enterica serovar Telhashomer]MKA98219.1 hypothetical prot